jgi:hypothetical protein
MPGPENSHHSPLKNAMGKKWGRCKIYAFISELSFDEKD